VERKDWKVYEPHIARPFGICGHPFHKDAILSEQFAKSKCIKMWNNKCMYFKREPS